MPGDEGENEYTYAGSVHLREFPSQKGFLASLATPRMGKSNTVAIEIPFEVSKAKREEQQRDKCRFGWVVLRRHFNALRSMQWARALVA